MMTRANRAVTLGLLALPLVVATSGCKGHLDDAKIEQLIRTELVSKGVKVKTVDCPADRPLKEGDTFTCGGLDTDNQSFAVIVVQTNNAGAITYKLDGMIIDQKKIGDSIENKIGHSANVECPGNSPIIKVGTTFHCPVMVDGKPRNVAITLANDKGDVTWSLGT